MKAIDVIVLIAAVGFVGWMIYIKAKQHYENKKNGVIGCGGSCMGCGHTESCKEIQQHMSELIQTHKKG